MLVEGKNLSCPSVLVRVVAIDSYYLPSARSMRITVTSFLTIHYIFALVNHVTVRPPVHPQHRHTNVKQLNKQVWQPKYNSRLF